MKSLKINTTWATIEATHQRAIMQINNKMRRSKVTTTRPKMTVTRERPKMNVNWDKVWGESGRKNPTQMAQQTAAQGKQAAVDATIKYSADGSYVGDLHKYHGGTTSPFAQMAVNEMSANIPEVNFGSIPRSTPEISWDEGSMNIEWESGDVKIEWDEEYMPEFKVTPHSVEIRLNGKPQVHISLSEDALMGFEGRKFNKKI